MGYHSWVRRGLLHSRIATADGRGGPTVDRPPGGMEVLLDGSAACSLGPLGAGDGSISLLVGDASRGQLWVSQLLTGTAGDETDGDGASSTSRVVLPTVLLSNVTIASGPISLGASVAFLGQSMLGHRRMHAPVVAAGAPQQGELHLYSLHPTSSPSPTTTSPRGDWNGTRVAVVQSVTGAPGDSFGASLEYLGPLREARQDTEWGPGQATGEVSILVGAPDWRDLSLSR